MAATPQIAFDVSIDLQTLDTAIHDYADATGRAAADVLAQQAKLFARDVAKVTPPFDAFGSFEESFNVQRRTGEGAVAGDVRSAFRPLDALDLYAADSAAGRRFREVVRRQDAPAVAAILSRVMAKKSGGTVVSPARILARPDAGLHNSIRTARGRVRRDRREFWWVFSGRAVTGFVKEKQALVGRAKAGWLAVCLALGVRLPRWISRHGTGEGYVEDLSGRAIDPMIRIVNAVPYILTQDSERRFVSLALRHRSRSLRNALQARVDGLWGGPR